VFPSTFTTLSDAYNCSGQPVQAKRLGEGEYEIQFLGSPVTIPVGNVLAEAPISEDAFVAFSGVSGGDFDVNVYSDAFKKRFDLPFTVIVP
jgi:hypothetical protein